MSTPSKADVERMRGEPCQRNGCASKGDYGSVEKEGQHFGLCEEDYDNWYHNPYWDDHDKHPEVTVK